MMAPPASKNMMPMTFDSTMRRSRISCCPMIRADSSRFRASKRTTLNSTAINSKLNPARPKKLIKLNRSADRSCRCSISSRFCSPEIMVSTRLLALRINSRPSIASTISLATANPSRSRRSMVDLSSDNFASIVLRSWASHSRDGAIVADQNREADLVFRQRLSGSCVRIEMARISGNQVVALAFLGIFQGREQPFELAQNVTRAGRIVGSVGESRKRDVAGSKTADEQDRGDREPGLEACG